MLWIELESDRTEHVEEQLTDPIWCYMEDITTDTENGPETNDGENVIDVFFQRNETQPRFAMLAVTEGPIIEDVAEHKTNLPKTKLIFNI